MLYYPGIEPEPPRRSREEEQREDGRFYRILVALILVTLVISFLVDKCKRGSLSSPATPSFSRHSP